MIRTPPRHEGLASSTFINIFWPQTAHAHEYKEIMQRGFDEGTMCDPRQVAISGSSAAKPITRLDDRRFIHPDI